MPVANGLDFLRSLRQSQQANNVPVAIVTRDLFVDDETISRVLELGGCFYQGVLWEEELLGLVRDLVNRGIASTDERGGVRTGFRSSR
jgi:DNA-binding response OmpR family regulator